MEQVRFTASYTNSRRNFNEFLDALCRQRLKVIQLAAVALVAGVVALSLIYTSGNLMSYLILLMAGLFGIYREEQLYRRSLEQNNGKVWSGKIQITDQGVRGEYSYGHTSQCSFGVITDLRVTKSLAILSIGTQGNCTVDLRTLNGGTRQVFLAYIREKCPNIQEHRVILKGWLPNSFRMIALLSAVGLAFTLYIDSWVPPRSRTVEEAAAVLEELEIPVAQEHIAQLQELRENYNLPEEGEWILDLLWYVGAGEYDENMIWIPPTGGVYTFDMEAWEVGYMYTNFLNGVSAASFGELVFEDIIEDNSGINFDDGSGYKTISFTFRGQRYSVKAEMMTDWYDHEALNEITDIINGAASDKQLYFYFDGGQGIGVFYRDSAWVRIFEKTTGIPLTRDLRRLFMAY